MSSRRLIKKVMSFFPEPVISEVTTREQSLDDMLSLKKLEGFPVVELGQTHSSTIIELENVAQSHRYPHAVYADGDALMTQQKNIVLVVRTADCLPILIYHEAGMTGAVHAGRRGTQLNILGKTLTHFKQKNLKGRYFISFGPCICQACYEIDPLTKTHFDLIEENKQQIKQVLSFEDYQLATSAACTSCHNNRYYSYRKEAEKAGRFYSIISMRR